MIARPFGGPHGDLLKIELDASETYGEGYGALVCPDCGVPSLHQGDVVVRPFPSSNETEITFSCEQCGGADDSHRRVLRIATHKGQTLIGWVP